MRQGFIRHTPCHLISLPGLSRSEPRYLSAAEVERLAAAIDPRYRALIYTDAYLGLRWSELAGIKRTSVDLDGGQLFVVGALQRIGHDWAYTDQLKTTRSRRSLALAPLLIELLARHLKAAPPSEFVFSSAQGEILRYGNFRRRYWDPAVARSGLLHLTPHALRHTCVAMMIAEGANPLMVQRQLGHADLRMTLGPMDIYSRIGMTRSPNACRGYGRKRKWLDARPVRGLRDRNSSRRSCSMALDQDVRCGR